MPKISTSVNKFALMIVFFANDFSFPPNFKFGVASSAYQTEGGWNEDGKGPSVWDYSLHENGSLVDDNSNGDIACDSYHKWREDIALLKDLGVNYYRFSIAWSRIFPDGFPNRINEKGLEYYRNMLLELKANNIDAFVTLYHWDLPQGLQNLGGWANEIITDHVAAYADLMFQDIGHLVKYWVTINEPLQICQFSYGTQIYAPPVKSSGIGNYLCVHNILKAHSKVWRLYDEKYRNKFNGKISIVMESPWIIPASDTIDDAIAAENLLQFYAGWIANPIFNKNYPQVMIDSIGNRSQLEGFKESRLPKFTAEEIKYISGTYDFFGVNYYTTYLAKLMPEPELGEPSWQKDSGAELQFSQDWPGSSVNFWLKIYPQGLRSALKWIKENYNNPEIIITENGFSDSGELNDTDRISYIQKHLSSVLDAMVTDDINVSAYTCWGFLDDFEWSSGYLAKFGLVHVNFTDPNRTRTPKSSAEFYRNVIDTHCLVEECQAFDFPESEATKCDQKIFMLLFPLFLFIFCLWQ